MMLKAKADFKHGQGRRRPQGLGRWAGKTGSRRGPLASVLVLQWPPCSSLFERSQVTFPQIELRYCKDGDKISYLAQILRTLTTPLLPVMLGRLEPALAQPWLVALSQLKILVTWTNRNTGEKCGNPGGDETAIELRYLKLKARETTLAWQTLVNSEQPAESAW